MKSTLLSLITLFSSATVFSQSVLADFENFSMSPNSAYTSSTNVSFTTANAFFRHEESGGFWTGGFAYTNKYDSTTAGFTNLYGVKPKYGYNASSVYVIGQDKGIIKLKSPSNSVDGFYVTNTTYAYKSMRNGDQFAKKFGGVSGNDPDYLKLTVKGYLNGSMKNDSVVFMLADYTFTNNAQDYIVGSWQYVNTASLGQVDSIRFYMYSTDYSGGFMNTPAFFGLDNFSTSAIVGLNEQYTATSQVTLYPNPASEGISILVTSLSKEPEFRVYDLNGKILLDGNGSYIPLNEFRSGVYMAEIIIGEKKILKRIVKE